MANQKLRDVMTREPLSMARTATLKDAAEAMRSNDIGGICVTDDDGSLCGFVTDRDIVVRSVAQGQVPSSTQLGTICSREVTHLKPDDSVDSAIRLMAEKAIRRIPVIEDGKAVGILSIGDLAQARDKSSVLADISSAAPNR
jgi:CBS domain-containing protein